MSQSSLRPVWALVGAAAGLFLAWKAADTLLLIFGGILLGVLLDSLARALGRLLPLSHGWALALVCLTLALLLAGALAWSGLALVTEWDQLSRVLMQQLDALRYHLNNIGENLGAPRNTTPDGRRSWAEILLPDPSRLLGGASSAFSAAFGAFGSGFVVVLIGIFTAADPGAYRRGVLKLVAPERRARVGEVLEECGEVLRWWLVGQLVTMAIIGTSLAVVLAMLGVPGAVLLGLQAALVNFIPYLGPLLAIVPILLAAASKGTTLLLWALGSYVVIQTIEGYILTPLIQKRAVDLSPVLTLAGLMLFGALFGAAGIALATPLLAVVRVLVLRLYVDDYLQRGRAAAQAAS